MNKSRSTDEPTDDRTKSNDAPVHRIEELEAENEALRDRLNAIEEELSATTDAVPDRDPEGGTEEESVAIPSELATPPTLDEPDDRHSGMISRRGALAGLTGLGLMGLVGTASQPAAAAEGDPLTLGGTHAASTSSGHGVSISEQSSSGFSYGVKGISESDQGRGVYGYAPSSTGQTYGLWGRADSTQGTGLSGTATASTGSTQGVLATSKSDQGRGVFGRATSTSGETYGVYGQTLSGGDEAAGVLGEATDSSGLVHGVRGEAPNTPNGTGVLGTSLSDPAEFEDYSEGFGVYGLSDRRYGVFGYKPADNGTGDGAGIFGRSDTAEPAVWALASGIGNALETDGDAVIRGEMSVGSVGVSAYLGSSVTNFTGGTIPYDTVLDDDRNEFDTSTGEITLATGGDFVVEGSIDYGNQLAQGDTIGLEIEVNGVSRAQAFRGVTAAVSGPVQSVSKTLRGLSSGDVLRISAFISSSSDPTIHDGERFSFFTASKIG